VAQWLVRRWILDAPLLQKKVLSKGEVRDFLSFFSVTALNKCRRRLLAQISDADFTIMARKVRFPFHDATKRVPALQSPVNLADASL